MARKMQKWAISDIPSLKGRSAVVTGTGGLGYEDALALARAGCEVIVAGRDRTKGAEALRRIHATVSAANVIFEQLDLANLESVAAFCRRLRSQHERIDILINNAGIMVPPRRKESADGFELQLATNYLGHFALTAGLLPLLQKGEHPRVVTLSSVAARNGAINFNDLNATGKYDTMKVYSQSKLACLMFALEFQRRSEAGRWGVASMAAHPGISRTDLLHNAPGRRSVVGLLRSLLWFAFQPAAQGALPTLFAATSPQAEGGMYYGPDKLGETRGSPAIAKIPPQALDAQSAKRLWAETERLTGSVFP
jgi:NAD(P)-dependent dehydrogenase (short-subunit alcohol dehydrogenase family)